MTWSIRGRSTAKAERLQSQVDEIQSRLRGSESGIVENRTRYDYMAAIGRERLLAAAVVQEKVEVGALNQFPDPTPHPEA